MRWVGSLLVTCLLLSPALAAEQDRVAFAPAGADPLELQGRPSQPKQPKPSPQGKDRQEKPGDGQTTKKQPAEEIEAPEAQRPGGINLAYLESLALRHNPTLVQAAAAVRANWAEAYQSAQCPNPHIGYNASVIGIAGTAGELQGGFVQQTFVPPQKLKLNYAKNAQEAIRAQWQAEAQQWRVINAVRIRYYRLLMLQELIELRRRRVENAERWLETTQELLDKKKGLTQVDLILAKANLQQARVELEMVQSRYPEAWIELTSIIGVPALTPAPLQGPLTPDGPPLEWEPSLQYVLECSPEVKAAQAQVGRYQFAVRREKWELVPDVDAWASTGYDDTSERTVASVQIGIEVPVWDKNRGAIARERANITRARADVDRVMLSLRQRLGEVFQQYVLARRTAELYQDVSIPKLTETADLREQTDLSLNELISAERLLFQMKEQYIESLFQIRQAEIKITGLLLVDGLSQP